MREQIFIYDSDDALINDPERSTDYATGLRWDSYWPKGYGTASFVVARDIAATWGVKMAYKIKIRDGLRTVYSGKLGPLNKQMRGTEESITVSADGWYKVLADRKIRKRWADNAAIDRLELHKDDDEEHSFPVTKRDDKLIVRMNDSASVRAGTERYEERYDMPTAETVKRITFDYRAVGGEEKEIEIYNGTPGLESSTAALTNGTGSVDLTLATPTQRIIIKIGPDENDTYDQNDKIVIKDLTAYSETGTIDAKAIIEDILAMIGDEISADFSQIANPGLTLVPFMTLGDAYETGDKIIQRAAGYGDASLNTWGFSVWDEFGASDGLPRGEFTYRDITAYDYAVSLDDLVEFSDSESDNELYNYIVVKYQDENNITRYRTPTDNASLADSTSAAAYGRRDYVYDIGAGDTTRADYLGERFLAYHKDPLRQTRLVKDGLIRATAGIYVPCSLVRAGKRVKVLDYHGGEIFFLRHVSYDAEKMRLTMEPDLPPDSLEIQRVQEELK